MGSIYLKESRAYPYDASMENLRKAKASPKWHPPRPWRSKKESHMIRRFAYMWFTCRDSSRPSCRAYARGLGVSHTWIWKLVRQFQKGAGQIGRLQAAQGTPRYESLLRAKQQTEWMRARGELRPLRRCQPKSL